jgi:hypothetical protein
VLVQLGLNNRALKLLALLRIRCPQMLAIEPHYAV